MTSVVPMGRYARVCERLGLGRRARRFYDVHVEADDQDLVALGPASTLSAVLNLLNELRRRYESHRQNHFVHQHVDLVDRVTAGPVRATVDVFPGPLTGPFSWTLL